MRREQTTMSHSCAARAHVNQLPTELWEKIIREYSTVPITLQRSSAMNFLVTCPVWTNIGQSCQGLFIPDHLVVSGHDELQQLLALYKGGMIPHHITSLTVSLAPTYPHPTFSGSDGPTALMVQTERDLTALRDMIFTDWAVTSRNAPDRDWKTLSLDRFSLYVDLSAVSAKKPLIQGWTRHWVYKVSEQWRGMGWTGSKGFYDGGFYSYWDR